MKRRRSEANLEAAVENANSKSERAIALYNLAVFHDNNSREAKAIPLYENALRLGLVAELRAQAFAWLASSLFKTNRRNEAILAVAKAREATGDRALREFLDRLGRRIKRA